MGQPEQPPPQEDLPFFLFLIMLTIIRAITAKRIVHMMMVDKFAVIHVNICIPPFSLPLLLWLVYLIPYMVLVT